MNVEKANGTFLYEEFETETNGKAPEAEKAKEGEQAISFGNGKVAN